MSNTITKQTRKVGVAGGFINQLMGNNSTLPEIGKGATLLYYSDREAFEVIEVSEDKLSCKIRKMNATFVGQSYGDERYSYESCLENPVYNLEWNDKKQCWGKVYYSIEIIKSLAKRLQKEHGFDWTDFLPVPYKSIIDKEKTSSFTYYKLIEGVTKKYKNFEKVSVIFGIMDQYRDPTF